MFNDLIKVYDWYHDNIAPSCAPKHNDTNILCPIYYGKVATTKKTNSVEVLITSSGEIGNVRKFSVDGTADASERYALTPSCIQHRRRGASANDREYQFFNKFSVLFGENRNSWITMFEQWIQHHLQSGKNPKTISIIEQIVNVITKTDKNTFLERWNPSDDSNPIIDDRTILVFTDNGKKIFDNNSDLYQSYCEFYEQWCAELYTVEESTSSISGSQDLIIKAQDGSPIAFGIGYSNGRKFITKTNANATLDARKRFNVQQNFSNYTIGLRDLWKIHSVFDYLSEQQGEYDIETRNIFFFVPSASVNCTYEQSLLYKEMLTALKQYHAGYKWQCPPHLKGVILCYMYWTSSSNGRSSISDYQTLPAEQYVENIALFYKFFPTAYEFCLYKIPNLLETESKFVKKSQHELIQAILNARQIPEHIVRRFVEKSFNPIKTSSEDQASRHSGYSGKYVRYYYRNVLDTTIGILLYNEQIRTQKGTMIHMALDRNCTNRSYLYGRLTAIYQRAEEIAMPSSDGRTTNAEKSMNMISLRPNTSIHNLGKRIQPYLNRLSNNNPSAKIYIDKLLQETYSNFEEKDFEDSSPLDSNFLLGYYCQRQDMFQKKEDSEEQETNND